LVSPFGLRAAITRGTASGSRSITVREARVEPAGDRRPCSQFLPCVEPETEALGELTL
jgi:hypothetical protein